MKTKDFIEKVRDLGYDVDKNGSYIFITNEWSNTFATIILNKILSVDTDYSSFKGLEEHDQILLFDLIIKYARTPLEEREGEKKYRYKIKHNINNNEPTILHVIRLNDTTIELDGSSERYAKLSATFHFTDKEVEKYTGKDRALFNVCEKIEVTSND